MDRTYIQECEESLVKAATLLDNLEAEFSDMWLIERASATSDQSATHATTSTMGPFWNQLKAKVTIARLRLENAYDKGYVPINREGTS